MDHKRMTILEKYIHGDKMIFFLKSTQLKAKHCNSSLIPLTRSTSSLEKLEGVKFINFSEDLLLERIEPGLICRQPLGLVLVLLTSCMDQEEKQQRRSRAAKGEYQRGVVMLRHDQHKLSPWRSFMKLFPRLTSCIATRSYS